MHIVSVILQRMHSAFFSLMNTHLVFIITVLSPLEKARFLSQFSKALICGDFTRVKKKVKQMSNKHSMNYFLWVGL